MNWVKLEFKSIDKLLKFINTYKIERFGVIPSNSLFGGYVLIFKK